MRLKDMTTKEAIRQLQDMKQYCTAKSIPALDYAIKALKKQQHNVKDPRLSRGSCIFESNSV